MGAKKHRLMLECTVCKSINYLTFRNVKSAPEKLELDKFCKKCRKITPHKESKAK